VAGLETSTRTHSTFPSRLVSSCLSPCLELPLAVIIGWFFELYSSRSRRFVLDNTTRLRLGHRSALCGLVLHDDFLRFLMSLSCLMLQSFLFRASLPRVPIVCLIRYFLCLCA
jgi:hypothetical protein